MKSSLRVLVLIYLAIMSTISTLQFVTFILGMNAIVIDSTIIFIADGSYYFLIAGTFILMTYKYYDDSIRPILREVA
jgi:hypothetical protein